MITHVYLFQKPKKVEEVPVDAEFEKNKEVTI